MRLRGIVLAAIRAYQRYLSPHKGFRCAYRLHTGRASCSTLGYRAVRSRGVFTGLALIRERTSRCGELQRRHRPPSKRPPAGQRGDCDLPCDCDLPSGRGLARACDFLSCCDCGSCDWPRRGQSQPTRRRPGRGAPRP